MRCGKQCLCRRVWSLRRHRRRALHVGGGASSNEHSVLDQQPLQARGGYQMHLLAGIALVAGCTRPL
jgi:hypothetical protein